MGDITAILLNMMMLLPDFGKCRDFQRGAVFSVLKNMLGCLANSESSFLMKRKH